MKKLAILLACAALLPLAGYAVNIAVKIAAKALYFLVTL